MKKKVSEAEVKNERYTFFNLEKGQMGTTYHFSKFSLIVFNRVSTIRCKKRWKSLFFPNKILGSLDFIFDVVTKKTIEWHTQSIMRACLITNEFLIVIHYNESSSLADPCIPKAKIIQSMSQQTEMDTAIIREAILIPLYLNDRTRWWCATACKLIL